MLLEAKIYELYNFIKNQDLDKGAFFALLGPELLAYLEESYPKLMRIGRFTRTLLSQFCSLPSTII